MRIHSIFVRYFALPTFAAAVALPALAQDRDRAPRKPAASAPSAPADAAGQWTIILGTFSGEDHHGVATQAAARIASETGLTGLRVEPRGRGTVVTYGSYPEPNDAARKELERIRALTMGGQAVFATAFIAPPSTGSDLGLSPMFHLSKAREEFGARAKYTLQVGVYESPKRDEAMRAAEQAALALRREGESAFYYHGPQRSMVTIGAFAESEVGAGGSRPSPALEALQRRHPLNLLNGNRPLVEKRAGAKATTNQASFLVMIPEA
ncbi:MAG: hypothetical protein IBJ10_05525 [Phycisphaerales bacterium]|nr:hypothetical protein [Phycisphaerales bacterium]